MKLGELPWTAVRDMLKLMILFAIPAVLAGIYFGTSLSFQQSLALDHTDPRLLNFWTNALVHDHRSGDGHLIGNIIGYLLLVFPCWSLLRDCNLEHRFWTGLAVILAVGPVIISISSYIAFSELLGLKILNDRGFSGVVSALAGFLLVSVLDAFAQTQDEPVAALSMGLYFGCLILGLGVLTGRIVAVGLGALLLVGTFVATRTRYLAPVVELSDWGYDNPRLGLILVIAVFVSILGFGASLPSGITGDGAVTNIVAHGAGIVFGMAVAGGLQYWYSRSSVEGMTTT